MTQRWGWHTALAPGRAPLEEQAATLAKDPSPEGRAKLTDLEARLANARPNKRRRVLGALRAQIRQRLAETHDFYRAKALTERLAVLDAAFAALPKRTKMTKKAVREELEAERASLAERLELLSGVPGTQAVRATVAKQLAQINAALAKLPRGA